MPELRIFKQKVAIVSLLGKMRSNGQNPGTELFNAHLGESKKH